MHCLARSLLWQEILGGQFVCPNKMFVLKNLTILFLKKTCLSPCPKRIWPLIKPLFKSSCSTNFQGTGPTGPWEGPVHFSRFVLKVHNNCSKLFQSWSWNQEKKEKSFTKAIEKFKAQAFPKRIRPLIKCLSLYLPLPRPLPVSLSLSLSLCSSSCSSISSFSCFSIYSSSSSSSSSSFSFSLSLSLSLSLMTLWIKILRWKR